MKWKKFTIQTTTEAEDFLSAMLDEMGIEGIEIENNVPLTKDEQSGMFIDFLPELPADEGISYVSFYLEDTGDDSEILSRVRAGIEEQRQFVDVGEGSITVSETKDLDWMNNWKEFFHAFSIENIVIKPVWEELKEEDQDKILIEIDPGISFGTGKHETTQLCIRQLLKYIQKDQGQKALDVGCGSGILSIVALKLGAGSVVGTDIDENCMVSAKENMKMNHLPESSARFYMGNLIDDQELLRKVGEESFDIVVANILADVIIPMAPVIPSCLKPGGIFITSGIIDFKEEEVKSAIEATGLEILEINRQGEWVNLTAVKK
ncbi:MAG: 50S ribosomal protein L11 methyltransferase [Eubacterium sp.]|jgi:ribosomal protein L11 methyltransferase|nr:50S ribosomal protein L11 methyltransferase [Eubacterium sp.]